VVETGLPPLLSAFLSISTVAAITGSASGGLQIFMASLAPRYLEMGIEPEVLHRISTLASGGFDSLPHCGADRRDDDHHGAVVSQGLPRHRRGHDRRAGGRDPGGDGAGRMTA
jgi:hypothetical protein